MMKKSKKYIFLFAGIVCSYLLYRICDYDYAPELVKGIMAGITAGCAILMLCGWKSGKLNAQDICNGIILAGIVMRVGYMLYTGCEVRSHDMHDFTTDSYGHAAYILTLIQKGKLPETNIIQFYQQPFYYILGAGVSKIINMILRCKDAYYLVDATKLISCFASCSILFIMEKLCDICCLKEKGRVAALAVVAFTPVFYLCGGRVNCDALASLFILMEFVWTLQWNRCPSLKNTLLLAVIYGCGVMTKISCGIVAIFTVLVFTYQLICRCHGKDRWKLVGKYSVFGLVSLPLGLWYSVRNYILFQQPLMYVLEMPEDSGLYMGDYSLFSRLFAIDISNLLKTPYGNPWADYNAPVYYLKSSLFGEFTYQIWTWIPIVLLLSGTVLSVMVVYVLIWNVRYNRSDRTMMCVLGAGVLYYLSMLWFYFRYPFGCSMDYRYMMFMSAAAACLLGSFYEKSQKEQLNRAITAILISFAVMSCSMYVGI